MPVTCTNMAGCTDTVKRMKLWERKKKIAILLPLHVVGRDTKYMPNRRCYATIVQPLERIRCRLIDGHSQYLTRISLIWVNNSESFSMWAIKGTQSDNKCLKQCIIRYFGVPICSWPSIHIMSSRLGADVTLISWQSRLFHKSCDPLATVRRAFVIRLWAFPHYFSHTLSRLSTLEQNLQTWMLWGAIPGLSVLIQSDASQLHRPSRMWN